MVASTYGLESVSRPGRALADWLPLVLMSACVLAALDLPEHLLDVFDPHGVLTRRDGILPYSGPLVLLTVVLAGHPASWSRRGDAHWRWVLLAAAGTSLWVLFAGTVRLNPSSPWLPSWIPWIFWLSATWMALEWSRLRFGGTLLARIILAGCGTIILIQYCMYLGLIGGNQIPLTRIVTLTERPFAPNLNFSSYLAILGLLVLVPARLPGRWAAIVGIAFAALPILNQSRGAVALLLLFAVGGLWSLKSRWLRWATVVIVAGGTGTLIWYLAAVSNRITVDESFAIRMRTLLLAWDMIQENPLFGSGPGSADGIVVAGLHNHSRLLNLAVEFGVPAGALLLAMGLCSMNAFRDGPSPKYIMIFGSMGLVLLLLEDKPHLIYSLLGPAAMVAGSSIPDQTGSIEEMTDT